MSIADNIKLGEYDKSTSEEDRLVLEAKKRYPKGSRFKHNSDVVSYRSTGSFSYLTDKDGVDTVNMNGAGTGIINTVVWARGFDFGGPDGWAIVVAEPGVRETGWAGPLEGVEEVAYKEKSGKLPYELDWRFIEAMAKRMANEGDKYQPYNWKKPMTIKDIKDSLTRHFIEIAEGSYDDEGVELDHLPALATNAMILFYQLKNNKQ